MPSPPFKGLLVGLGVMGSYHLRVLSSLRTVELVGVVDPSAERRAAVARTHPHVPGFETLEDALAATAPDFAGIAAPVGLLPELAIAALEAGLGVLVEKPLAPDEPAGLEILRAAERTGGTLAVGHVERFNPAVRALKERLDAGEGGRVFQIHARRLSPFPFRQSMTGVALDLATHDLDLIRYLTQSEVSRVYAETASRAPGSAEDLVSASLRLDNGVTGVLDVNWLTPTKVRELSVTAEGGMWVVNYLTQDLSFYENPRKSIEWDTLGVVRGTGEGDMTRFAIERREPLLVEWESFVERLATGSGPSATGQDGFAALSIATAIQRSGAAHEPVTPGYREPAAQPSPALGVE